MVWPHPLDVIQYARSSYDYNNVYFSTQLSMTFIMLIKVKMPTIVGILTFISMVNTTSESLKVRNNLYFLVVYEQIKFHTQLS